MDKLTYYKSYVAIVDKGSLKSAADYLNLSASAVSKHLSTLEQYYSVDLVIRDAKNIRITAEGKSFYHKCKEVLATVIQAEDLFINNKNGATSMLRITLSQVLSQGKLMSLLSLFTQLHPQIKLDIVVSNNNLDLVKHDIDFAFRGGTLNDSQMRYMKLFKTKTILCAPISYKKELTAEQQVKMITDNLLIPSYVNLSTLRTYLQKIGIKKSLDQFILIDDAFSYKYAVLSGMGVGIFLDFFIEPDLAQQKLWHIEKPYVFDYRSLDINMIFHKNIKLSKSHELFKNFISEHFQKNL